MREFKINENEAGQRFDKYLKSCLAMRRAALYTKCSEKEYYFKWEKGRRNRKVESGRRYKTVFSDETFEKFSGSGTPDSEFEALKVLSRSLHQENGNFRLFMKIKM